MKLNQKGFGAIEVLLTVIALTLIAGVGFYVYNANKEKKTDTSAQTQQSTTPKPAENTKKYLEVKELGIKFELNDKLKNAYYAKVGDFYYLSVRDFDNNPRLSGCAAGGPNNSLGVMAIVEGKVGEKNTSIAAETNWTQTELDRSAMKKVGDAYYGFMRGNGPCYDPTGENGDSDGAIVDETIKAFVKQQETITKL